MTGSNSTNPRAPGPAPAGCAGANTNGLPQSPPAGHLELAEGLSFAGALDDCLLTGVIMVDSKQRVVSLNDHARKLLGLRVGRVKPPALAKLPAALRALVREVRTSGQPPGDRQLELKAGSHGPITLRASAVPLSVGRKNSGVLLLLNDLTPARRIEQHIRLEQAAAESFLHRPTDDSLHSRTTSRLVN